MAYRPITEEARDAVRALLAQGMTDAEIARRTGVSRTTVARIRARTEPPAQRQQVTTESTDQPPSAAPSKLGAALRGRLRKLLVGRNVPPVWERRNVPRRTYAFYLPEEIGEAIKGQARLEGVAPSQVLERVLYRAQLEGWLPTLERLQDAREFLGLVEAAREAVARKDVAAVRKVYGEILAQMRLLMQSDAGAPEGGQDDGTPRA